MTTRKGTSARLFALLLGLLGALLHADSLDLSWHTFDGGGEMFSTGGDFQIGGTIGQADAGAVMTGGDYQLIGGFWAGDVAPPAPGDCDGDGDVDLTDFEAFVPCMTGPQGGLGPGCSCCDLDADGDVDLADFARFQRAFTGSAP